MTGSIIHSVSLRVDAHHHLWRYNREEFDWLEGPLEVLRRDFMPEDLLPSMRAAAIDGLIAVQARQTLEETRWLLQIAAETPEILGVVGWAPLADPNFCEVLESVRTPFLKGLRHVIQAETDPDFILRRNFNEGVRCLEGSGLVYDILVFERQLPQTIAFVDLHPNQQFVVDHVAKPRIADGAVEPWATLLRELGRRPNVACKLSGMVTEADHQRWAPEQLTRYLEMAVEAFGPARLMAGSDWPVLLAACEYGEWFQLLGEFFAAFGVDEQAAVFGGNASAIYHLLDAG